MKPPVYLQRTASVRSGAALFEVLSRTTQRQTAHVLGWDTATLLLLFESTQVRCT